MSVHSITDTILNIVYGTTGEDLRDLMIGDVEPPEIKAQNVFYTEKEVRRVLEAELNRATELGFREGMICMAKELR